MKLFLHGVSPAEVIDTASLGVATHPLTETGLKRFLGNRRKANQ